MTGTRGKNGFLENTRVYLSGPMDFVASRAEEKKFGWRAPMDTESLGKVSKGFNPLHKGLRED